MGLTTWKNALDGRIKKYDVDIAKNYLNKDEIKKLENLTELFLNVAQTEAEEQKITTTNINWYNLINVNCSETHTNARFLKNELLHI